MSLSFFIAGTQRQTRRRRGGGDPRDPYRRGHAQDMDGARQGVAFRQVAQLLVRGDEALRPQHV